MKIQTIITVLVFTTSLLFSQTFDDKSISQLEELKTQAATNENFELAAKYKKALQLKREIKQSVEVENYEKAARLKNELKALNHKTTSNNFSHEEKAEFVFNENIGEIGCTDNNWRKGNIYGSYARFHGERAQEVFQANDIVYYGIDITYSKLIDKKNLGKGKLILAKNAEKFNSYFNQIIKVKDLQRWMKKKSMMKGTDIFSTYKNMDMNNFVIDQNYCLSFSDIEKIIEGYSLNEKDGIGMVINIANFNENFNEKRMKEFISLYITFFDIHTRNILYAVEATGLSAVPTAFWHKRYGLGTSYALRTLFIDRIYLQGVTDIEQLPEKFRLDK